VSIDLRLGRWETALAGVTCDALIVDAPYSAKTHGGHDSAPTVGLSPYTRSTHGSQRGGPGGLGYEITNGVPAPAAAWVRRAIDYAGWTPDDVRAFVASWSPRTSGWMVSITDHVLAPVWAEAMAAHGRYVFAPLPWVASGSRVRLTGDGPSSWTCWIIVGRPTTGTYRDGTPAAKWGTLPGAYVITQDRNIVVGGKPLDLMRAIVRDYSRPGDLVVDPCSGGASTLIAAAIEGRRAIGAEMDADTHAQALARIARGYTPVMQMPEVLAVQGGLDLGGARG
jgi:hypothetical protein